jgi:hypothetical protein
MLQSCEDIAQSTSKASTSGQTRSNLNSGNNSKQGHYIKLKKHEIMDREGTGMVASTYLLPEGWTTNDKLWWEYGDTYVPIRYKGTYKSQDGSMMIQAYPDVRSNQSSGPTGTTGYPPPSDIVTGLKELIRQERRGLNWQAISGKILPGGQAPKTSMQQGSTIRTSTQLGVVKVAYSENGHDYEEEFYGQLDLMEMYTPGIVNLSAVIWGASGLYSCKAIKGKLDECRKIAMTLKSSAKPTLAFYNKFSQVVKILEDQGYQRIYQAGQISKIISQTNDQVLKTISDSYNQTQKSYDRVNNQFSDYVRGVDNYEESNGTEVQLPSGYTNAWVNNRGEYLLSDSPGFDPGVEFKEDWKQLAKR